MNLISIVIGLIGAVFMFVGIIPLLGWLNWIALAACGLGGILGAFAEKKTGLIINIIVIAIAILRLAIGGGFV